MFVTLDAQELVTAGGIGLRRQIAALTRGYQPVNGGAANDDPVAFGHHIMGAMAEFSVAKVLNLFWAPNIGEVKKGDVGGVIEVRARRAPGTGLDLAVRPRDLDESVHPYLLVHCQIPEFRLIGWARADEHESLGSQWNEQRQLWYVPWKNLHPLDTLPHLTR